MGDSLRGATAAPAGGAEEKLLVAIRPRPVHGEAPDTGLRLTPGAVELPGEGALLFDRVYAPEADNGAVYDDVAAPVVAAVLRGISGAVAAYGQTGSGKTRTMRGVPDDPGLVPRAVRGPATRRQAARPPQLLVQTRARRTARRERPRAAMPPPRRGLRPCACALRRCAPSSST